MEASRGVASVGPALFAVTLATSCSLSADGQPTLGAAERPATATTTRRTSSAGKGAVVCSEDRIEASNGFHVVPVGVAGPIEVGR